IDSDILNTNLLEDETFIQDLIRAYELKFQRLIEIETKAFNCRLDISKNTLNIEKTIREALKIVALMQVQSEEDTILQIKAFLRIINDQIQRIIFRYHSQVGDKMTTLQHLSITDPLTKILNRNGLMRVLRNKLVIHENGKREKKETERSICIIMIDIDHFKNIHDTHGHLAGDYILEQLARILEERFRIGVDAIGRFGGEEFMIVFEGNKEDAETATERFRKTIEDHTFLYKNPKNEIISIRITVSIGISDNKNSVDPNIIIETSDQALYTSKENGRNQITYRAT